MEPTQNQINAIGTLRYEMVESVRTRPMANGKANPQRYPLSALAYSLPRTAETKEEASKLIDAYKDVLGYARNNREWAMPILAKVAEIIGNDGANTPAIGPRAGYSQHTIGGFDTAEEYFASVLA